MASGKRDGTRWERLRAAVERQYHHHFPERQIYFRSRGVVRFLSLSPRFQAISLAVAFTVTCWVGIASANLVFGNHVIERKDRQIADLREIRGDLHKQLLDLQDEVLNRTQTLQARQDMIDDLLSRSRDAMLGNLPARALAGQYPSLDAAGLEGPLPVGGPATLEVPRMAPLPHRSPELRKKTPRLPIVLRGEQSSETDDPLARKLREIEGMQDMLIVRMDNQVRTTIDRYEEALKIAGLNTDKVLASSVRLPQAQGGPYLPLRWVNYEDERQTEALMSLMQNVDRLSLLYRAFERAPLALPVDDDFYVSSHFGGRKDPFNGAWAFHSGVDLGSRTEAAAIRVTAPGRVVFAGRDGPYGLMIEVDHGNGFSTRYGHLNKIVVRQGQRVALREEIGVMGSSGRSTGVHLHYEVRFNGTPLNPLKIFKAAKHVQAL
jgi:murein DD-endopeptidase MepM/ murein hydrolase activator NlpD